jgi:hypothetical protein
VIERADLVAWYRLARRRRGRWVFLFSRGAVGSGAIGAAVALVQEQWLVGVLVYLALVLTCLGQRAQASPAFEVSGGHTTAWWDGDALAVAHRHGIVSRVPWASIDEVVERDGRTFLLVAGGAGAYVLPDRGFASPEARRELIDLARGAVSPVS